MALEEVSQFNGTIADIMNLIAPHAGGTVPASTDDEYTQWFNAILMKYEEASRRGFWRRLLTKDDTLSLTEGDEELVLPDRFQRANSLYIFAITDAEGNSVDLADPDRIPDGQSIFVEQINDPEDEDFGKWKVTFATPIEADTDVTIWYFATPPKPTASTDIVLLPGDMLAFGAMIEIFRSKNLPGSQDDARQEYENRLGTYLAMEMIPPRNEILKYETNPRHLDRMVKARTQYTGRVGRTGRSM